MIVSARTRLSEVESEFVIDETVSLMKIKSP